MKKLINLINKLNKEIIWFDVEEPTEPMYEFSFTADQIRTIKKNLKNKKEASEIYKLLSEAPVE